MTSKPTAAVSPYEWHKRPKQNKRGPCPYCGFPGKGEHHRVEDPDALYPRYVRRWKSGSGWQEETVDSRPKRPRADGPAIPRPPRQPKKLVGPSDGVRQRMIQVLRAHVFGGKTISQIAKEMEITQQSIREWQRRYRAAWDEIEETLTNEVIGWVREAVAGNAALDDPDLYLARAKRADTWCQAAGDPLFSASEEATLCSFYHDYYLPVRLASDARQSTRDYHEVCLRRWRLVTGDPPLKSITAEMLARFRDSLTKSRGLRPWQRMSPNSIRSMLRTLQSILDKAGPPGPRNRDAAGILSTVPWVKPPRPEDREPRIVPIELVNAAYEAAACMEFPRLDKVKPPKWWRALIVLVFNTGMRKGTVFRLRWEWVDWQNRLIAVPAASMKSRRVHVSPLNETVLRHLHSIRDDDRELIFPWPINTRAFHDYWHSLLDLAGIPRDEHFGLHGLRRTLATTLWKTSPQAARLALGHRSMETTIGHYVNAQAIVAAAIEDLPQPAAFTAG